MVLVDTSVWSLALRRKPEQLNSTESSIVTELAELIREGRARLIGLIRQELLSGVKMIRQYEKLRTDLRKFPDERVITDNYEFAAKASNDCNARGLTVSVVDALICSVALSRDLSIFTTDPDFSHLAKILPIKLHMPRK